MSGILLANIDQSTTVILSKLLKTEGYKVDVAVGTAEVERKLSAKNYELALASAGANSTGDLDVIRKIRTHNSSLPVIAIIDNADAVTLGAISEVNPFACLQKPLKIDQLLSTVQRAVDFQGLLDSGSVNLNLQLESAYQFKGIVAESPVMKSVSDMISRVAGTDVTVLVIGENGTGKSLVARTLHEYSRRKDRQMVTVDCSKSEAGDDLFGEAGQPSALDRASVSTLYLKQIQGLSVENQDLLAKVLETKKFSSAETGKERILDSRIIVSATGNIEELAAGGDMSARLYKMLKVIVIKIPPLRERREDIVPNLRIAMQSEVEKSGGVLPNMDQKVIDLLQKYPWPGNSKEIEMVAIHSLTAQVNGSITLESLPPQIKTAAR